MAGFWATFGRRSSGLIPDSPRFVQFWIDASLRESLPNLRSSNYILRRRTYSPFLQCTIRIEVGQVVAVNAAHRHTWLGIPYSVQSFGNCFSHGNKLRTAVTRSVRSDLFYSSIVVVRYAMACPSQTAVAISSISAGILPFPEKIVLC
jgi:hypothetical protein